MIVGVLGCGTLGQSIAAGLRAHPQVDEILTSTRHSGDNHDLARRADALFVCVKPFQVEAVLREIAPELRAQTLLISNAASISAASVWRWSGEVAPVIRAMPNMPARIGAGMTVLCAGPGADATHVALAEALYAPLGLTVTLDERLMDAATGISGCGPAYAYLIIEALSDAGVKLGLPRGIARTLVAQTMLGSARMVLASDEHPAALKDQVTTPAGCTIDGLMELEDGKLRHTLLRAAVAAAERSKRLASPD